jgi:hypothetical protein
MTTASTNEDKEPRDPWPVSRERWSMYLEREVELAAINIQRHGSSILSSDGSVQEAKRRIKEASHGER